MKKIFFILFMIIACSPCKDDPNCHASVTISNKSDKIIYFDSGSSTPEIGYNPLQSGEYFKLVPETPALRSMNKL
jgi:hypothetical protein